MRVRGLLEDMPGERVDGTVYEVFASDWDKGLWDEKVERMRNLVDPDTDTLIFWHVVEGKLVRTCIGGRFAQIKRSINSRLSGVPGGEANGKRCRIMANYQSGALGERP